MSVSGLTRLTMSSNLWFKETWSKLRRTKQISGSSDMLETQLNRCLSTFDITLLGIGHMVGSGVYVLTAPIAKKVVGPAIVVAYIISGFASLLAALCYAEFSVRFPRAGSAYSYTYLVLGEFWAFTVGWNMVMENLIGVAVVSRACSAYIDSLLGGIIREYTLSMISGYIGLNLISQHIDLFAAAIVTIFVSFLTCGVRTTSYLNNVFSLVNIVIILVIILVGGYFADKQNWSLPDAGFMPFGWKGVFAASASCFYAFIGFDSIATSGEEAKDPQKSIPIATMISMAFATLAYVGVSAVLTLMIPFNEINDESGLPDALGRVGAGWAKILVIIGASCGMITVLVGTMYALTRIVYAMADDGLLFSWMSKVNEKTQIPLYAMYFFASIGAVLALFLDINTLVEMMSIGTLLAYLVVSASVIIVRYQPMEPIHQQLTCDLDDQQELNELSTESPRRSINDDHFLSSSIFSKRGDSISSSTNSSGLLQSIRGYFSRLRLLRYAPRSMPTICVFIMVKVIFLLCALGPLLIKASENNKLWLGVIAILAIILALSFAIIALHEQNTSSLRYKVPFVPFVPTLSIVFNATLMTNLQPLTWLRLIVWMTFGFIIYFIYGIKHSSLDPESNRVATNVRNWGSLDDQENLADNRVETGDSMSIGSAY
ncbi:cationic amino acid transporter 4-like [Tetranychus urticae]|uniref:Cationic amino acid transporter C-terminal domain-containing protein n=1 Tax=Tetranychus urticae TaxID=32264 RepID=T1L0G3_TETUR|nr:cationic amino acid transporter 4-like [Tetranychus urticae]